MPRVYVTLLLIFLGVGLVLAVLLRGTSSPLASIPAEKPELPALIATPLEETKLPSHLVGVRASRILLVSVKRCRPEILRWVRADLRQEVRYGSIDYSATGRFLQAPKQRLRLDLEIRTSRRRGRLTLISDGKLLGENLQLGGLPASIRIKELPQVPEPSDDIAEAAVEREEILHKHAFRGVSSFVKYLHWHLRNPVVRGVKSGGNLLIEVRGKWVPDQKNRDRIPPHLRLTVQPRECRLYLNPESLWPVRVEWWGNEADNRQNRLLIQTEYLNAVVNQPLSAPEVKKYFTIPANWEDTEPDDAPVHRIDIPKGKGFRRR